DFGCHSQLILRKNHEPMKMTTSASPLIGAITLVSCANPSSQSANFGCSGTDSPDHQLRACIVEVGKFPPPLNESRVDIRDLSGRMPELPSARRCRGTTSSKKFFSSAPVQS